MFHVCKPSVSLRYDMIPGKTISHIHMAQALDSPGYRTSCKTRERRSAAPFRSISELEFRSMEPPCSSFNPENGLKAGLPLIHPEFYKKLYIKKILIANG